MDHLIDNSKYRVEGNWRKLWGIGNSPKNEGIFVEDS